MRELADLPAERNNVQAEQQLGADIAGLEQQLQYQEKDLAATRERVKKLDAEAAALQKVRLADFSEKKIWKSVSRSSTLEPPACRRYHPLPPGCPCSPAFTATCTSHALCCLGNPVASLQ